MDPLTINRIAVIRQQEFIDQAAEHARFHGEGEAQPGLLRRLLTRIGQQANRSTHAPAQEPCVDIRATGEQLTA